MKYYEDKTKAPDHYPLAEKRAWMKGYRHARYGIDMMDPDSRPRRKWPQAYTQGYWTGHAEGPWEGYPVKSRYEIVSMDRRTIYNDEELAMLMATAAQKQFPGYTFGTTFHSRGAWVVIVRNDKDKQHVGWLFDGEYMR